MSNVSVECLLRNLGRSRGVRDNHDGVNLRGNGGQTGIAGFARNLGGVRVHREDFMPGFREPAVDGVRGRASGPGDASDSDSLAGKEVRDRGGQLRHAMPSKYAA